MLAVPANEANLAGSLVMQRNPTPQDKNENERQHHSHGDPTVAPDNSIRSSLRYGPPRNVIPQPQQPRVGASRARQRRLPHQLNAQWIQESARADQECRR